MISLRFFLLSLVLCSSTYPLAAQRGLDFNTFRYIEPKLNELKKMASDSVRHYTGLKEAREVLGKELTNNDLVGRNSFAHTVPAVYLERYGQDTGRLVIAAAAEWNAFDSRIRRWRQVAQRVQELRTTAGKTELAQRYGEKIKTTVKSEDKLRALLQREIIRSLMFFNRQGKAPNFRKSDRYPSSSRGSGEQLTVSAGGSISAEDVLFSYPQNQMANFYPLESKREQGEVTLRGYVKADVREAAEQGELWVRWKSSKGKVLLNRAVVSGPTIAYWLPTYFFQPREVYEMSIVRTTTEAYDSFLDFYGKRELGDLINDNVFHREKKEIKPAEIYFKAYFRVSAYKSFFMKTLGHTFEPIDGPGTAYQVTMAEPLGTEELEGLHGGKPLGQFMVSGCRPVEEVLKKVYGDAAKMYYGHPRQAYVDYLRRNQDSLNIDSLVAIEFLPYKERRMKYRRLKYKDADGKWVYTQSRKLPLPQQPVQRNTLVKEATGQPITEDVFRDPSGYNDRPFTLMLRDTFGEAAQRLVLEVAPTLEARKTEYADILRQLNELSPQALDGRSFTEIVEAINPWYVTNPRDERLTALQTCFPDRVTVGYGLPEGVMRTTSGWMEVRGEGAD